MNIEFFIEVTVRSEGHYYILISQAQVGQIGLTTLSKDRISLILVVSSLALGKETTTHFFQKQQTLNNLSDKQP